MSTETAARRGLPAPRLPLRAVVLPDGSEVEVRGLTRGEILAAQDFEEEGTARAERVEVWLIACALEVSEDEARAWYHGVPNLWTGPLIDAIRELSGMGTIGGEPSAVGKGDGAA